MTHPVITCSSKYHQKYWCIAKMYAIFYQSNILRN